MNTLETLQAARDLITDPKRWTKGVSARNANGQCTGTHDPLATCWCAWGAICRFGGEPSGAMSPAVVRLTEVIGLPSTMLTPIFDWNDLASHAEVLAALDGAIAKERAA